MLKCKRCGSDQIVKSGMIRGKQRYLCRKCGCHFTEGDRRVKNDAVAPRAMCELFHALGAEQYRLIGKYLKRDVSLIHRWMNEDPAEYKGRWKGQAKEFAHIDSLFEEIRQSGAASGGPMLMADNVIGDLYVALIVQPRQ